MSSGHDSTTFLEWLRDEMKARNWQPKDLSDASNITLTQVTRVLKGEQEPGRKFLQAIAAGLHYPRLVLYYRAGWLGREPVRVRRIGEPAGDVALQELRAEQEELLAIFDQLSDEDQETLIWMARGFRERNKAKDNEAKTKAAGTRTKPAHSG